MPHIVDSVKKLSCNHCGRNLDPSRYKPLAEIACPACRKRLRVPASFGKFVLIERIGRGTSGVVFRAHDQVLQREVALKILHVGDDGNHAIAKDCLAEARALAKLNHPNIVQIHTVGQFKKQPFLVMELLSTHTLQAHTEPETMLSEAAVIELILSVAEGLCAAHRIGLIHMDVKPQNVVRDTHGRPKLIDFGAARLEAGSAKKITGTPLYVAPEVIRGREPDFRSDMYNLGATMYHLLAGEPPFPGKKASEVIMARLERPAPSLFEKRQDIHDITESIVARLLAYKPEERYGIYEALIEELRDAVRVASHDPPQLVGHHGPAQRGARPQSPITRDDISTLSTLGSLEEALRESDPPALMQTAPRAAAPSPHPSMDVSGTRSRRTASSTGLWMATGFAATLSMAGLIALMIRANPPQEIPPVAAAPRNQPPIAADMSLAAQGRHVGDVVAHDPDVGDRLTYRIISGNEREAFAIHPGTGRITVTAPHRLEPDRQHAALGIEISDTGRPPMSKTITVTIDGLAALARPASAVTPRESPQDVSDAGPKPVAHWPFNGHAVDEAGDLKLSVTDGVSFAVENHRGAVKFDGQSGCLMSDRPVTFFQGDYAVSLWFKTSDDNHQTMVSASPHGVLLELRDGKVRFLHRTTPGDNSGNSLILTKSRWNDGKWHHVAAVKQADRMSLFLDGQFEVAGPVLEDLAEPLDLTLGRWGKTQDQRHFNGLLRDVRLYDDAIPPKLIHAEAWRAPTPTPEPPAPAVSPSTPAAEGGGATPWLPEGLLVHYPFDDPAALGRDASGAGSHARVPGTIQAVAGRFGGALRLDGADDRLEIPAVPSSGMLSEFTLAIWFNGPTPQDGLVSLISQNEWRSHGIHWLLADRGTALQLSLKDAGPETDYEARIRLRPDRWHHLASSYHGPSRTIRFYLDGRRISTAETQQAARGQLGPGLVGNWNAQQGRALRGAIDDVRVYGRVLSDAEVRQLTVGQ